MGNIENSIAQIYKTDSARILAVLTRVFGTHNFDLAEDVLHDAFNKALIHWQKNSIPENPSAWIIQAAKNQAIDSIRANKTKTKFANDITQLLESEWSLGSTIEEEFKEPNIKDDQLRMIFMCCHENIKPDNRIPFILKTLCGFSIPAIARALLIPETTVKKRLLRTKEKLKHYPFELPPPEQLMLALDTVHTILYLLFNEGFHSSDKKKPINLIFCQEAIGLVNLLMNESELANQDTLALFALMHFNIARVDSKVDKDGFNIPLDLQERSLWKQEYINTANFFLNLAYSASAGSSGRFFIEANIAKEHCLAASFSKTNWDIILGHYDALIKIIDSPVVRLNRAIAIGYTGQFMCAIEQVESLKDHKLLKNSHMPWAILAHLNAMAGNAEIAYEKANKSKNLGGTPNEHRLMMQQIERLLTKNNHND